MKAYFLSDLHLGAPYFPDARDREKKVVAFLDSIKDDAEVIYLLGDILDYWYEYRYVVPRGFVRFFGKIAELTDKGVRVVWLIGNHDIWIFDYLPSELGVEVIDGYTVEEIDGKKFLLTHGDGVGKLKPSFKLLRSLFRSKFCQKLFSGIHPRWTVPFAYNWSSHSRKLEGPSQADAKRMTQGITAFSKEYLKKHPDISYFIFGHLHLFERYSISPSAEILSPSAEILSPSAEILSPSAEIIVLGEWLTTCSYALWNGHSLSLHTFPQ